MRLKTLMTFTENKMKYKVYEYEEELESLGKIHPVKITKYGKNYTIEQKISSNELNRREWEKINAKPDEKAKLYRETQSRFMRYMFNKRSAKQKQINYEPTNIENFNEKHKSAKELFEQDQAKLFD